MTLETGNDILAAAEWRQELIDTAIPFAVVMLLALVLLYLRYQGGAGLVHRLLFERRPVEDGRSWWVARREARARRREREQEERVTRAEAEHEEALARAALPAAQPLGPPTIGIVRRTAFPFGTSTLALMVPLIAVSQAPDPNGLMFVYLLVTIPLTVAIALPLSLITAGLVSLIPRRNPGIATSCGLLTFGSYVALQLPLPPHLEDIGWTGFAAIGILTGFVVGLADEGSRNPMVADVVTAGG